MESTVPAPPRTRTRPAGIGAGAPLSRIHGPGEALALVAVELSEAERELGALVMSDVAAVPAVGGYLVAAGGKRLRPALTAIGARAVGFEGPLARLMCVGELIHLGSLLHDDVVDDGETRRGKPAAHRIFGNAVTVLTGDFCLARAVLLASEAGGHAAVTALAAAVTEMAEGEVLQLQHAGDLSSSYEQYLEVVDRKSAALIAWCCAAAALASDQRDFAHALERFGRGVGTAFQITDDVLDYSVETGKTLGVDLRERKVTLPLLYAMSALPDLRGELEAGEPSSDRLPELVARVRGSGALEAALADARRFVDGSLDALSMLPAGEGRDALEVLGRHLVERAS
jgi:octaprenyl-diphosphate synthase